MKPYVILLFICFLAPLKGEVVIGSLSDLIYEYYDEPMAIRDEAGVINPHRPITKLLTSLTAQFIWKEKRNMLLLNLEIFGALGSLDGSFGKDGKLSGQLKNDSFYKGYFRDTPFFLRFGKYKTDLPREFGAWLSSGQGEVGYESETLFLSYSVIFYNWFNMLNSDGSTDFIDEKFHEDDILVHMLSFNWKKENHSLHFRLPGTAPLDFSDLRLFPSLSYRYRGSFLENDTMGGISFRKLEDLKAWVYGVRQETSLKYFDDRFKTSLLLGLLTSAEASDFSELHAKRSIASNYWGTSLDNRDFEIHYGSHFSYLYRQAGNIWGMYSLGVKQDLLLKNLTFWAGSSFHFSWLERIESDIPADSRFIGFLLSSGLKLPGLWSDNTLGEIYVSWFHPMGFSSFQGEQTRDEGFQLVIKLEHIIF